MINEVLQESKMIDAKHIYRYYNSENNIVSKVKNCLENSSKENGLTTGQVRSISSKLYRTLEYKSIDNILTLCEHLLNERK